jgi:hypothetical protein
MLSLLVTLLVVSGINPLTLEHSSLVKLSVVETLVLLLMLLHRISGLVVMNLLSLQLKSISQVINYLQTVLM